MTGPVETLARTLCRHDGNPEDVAFEKMVMWESYADEAARILHSIREPSDAMVVAGAECDSMLARDIFATMIDAAVEGGQDRSAR